MATHPYKSTPYEEGLELNRDVEGLQYQAGGTAQQPGLQLKDEPENLPYRKPEDPPYRNSDVNRHSTNGATQGTNPWGLGPLMFGLLIAAVTALVVGAAVGGGMSSAINAAHDSSCSTTGTVTTSIYNAAGATVKNSGPSSTATTNIVDYSVALPQDVNTIKWDCPSMTSFTTNNLTPNQNFNVACGVDYYNSIAAEQGGVVADIIGILAYSAQDCMEACSYLNQVNGQRGLGTSCWGITFNQDMSRSYANLGANCWLKNGTAVNPISCTACLSASL